MVANGNDNVNNVFSSFYNNFNKIINKHAPIKKLSNRKAKQLSKPWITSGIRASISIKNKLYASGDDRKYRFYRNKICNLIRLSKKRYYQNYFEHNITNIKKTWEGINELLNRRKKETRIISALKDNNHKMVTEASQIPKILNKHFATVGNRLASNCLLLRNITLIMLANANHQLYHFFHNQFYLRKLTQKYYQYLIANHTI